MKNFVKTTNNNKTIDRVKKKEQTELEYEEERQFQMSSPYRIHPQCSKKKENILGQFPPNRTLFKVREVSRLSLLRNRHRPHNLIQEEEWVCRETLSNSITHNNNNNENVQRTNTPYISEPSASIVLLCTSEQSRKIETNTLQRRKQIKNIPEFQTDSRTVLSPCQARQSLSTVSPFFTVPFSSFSTRAFFVQFLICSILVVVSSTPLKYVHPSNHQDSYSTSSLESSRRQLLNQSGDSFGFEPWPNATYAPPPQTLREATLEELQISTAPRIRLPPPVNISVILISWFPPAVRVQWAHSSTELRNIRMHAFQIIYHPVNSRYRIIQEVPPFYTNLTLDRLQPGIEYSLRINSLSESGLTNSSRLVQFISPDNESRRSHRKFINRPIHTYPDELQEGLQVREDEVVIVVLVLCAWVGCIFIFFNKWGKIRMLEPYQPQYKESFHASVHSIHPKPSRMNTCTSVPPNMISIESRGSLIGIGNDRDLLLLHHNRLHESGNLYQCASGTTYHHPAYRPRLNSVFVGNPYQHRDSLYPDPSALPKKAKSAEDLKSLLVVQVNQHAIHNVPSTSTSVL